jgi:hypothetical protein
LVISWYDFVPTTWYNLSTVLTHTEVVWDNHGVSATAEMHRDLRRELV